MMTIGDVYICEVCGNKVQVLEAGAGTLVCCGQDMTLARALKFDIETLRQVASSRSLKQQSINEMWNFRCQN